MGSALGKLYKPYYEYLNGNKFLISAIGGFWCMSIWFWLVSAILLYIDITGKPKWLRKYKVQTGQNTPMDMAKLKKTILGVLINNPLLNLVYLWPIYKAQRRAGCSFAVDAIPSTLRILRDLAASILVQEIVFYYTHRLIHHPLLYKRVHKKHHEWTSPIGVVAIYATPLEYLYGNGLSVFLGPLLMKSHIMTYFLWYTIGTIGTVIHHSGYHFPLLLSPQFHDYHHLTYNYNYGTIGLLDWLHGTDKQFRNDVQSKRHRTLWSLTPMHEKIKDQKKEDVEED